MNSRHAAFALFALLAAGLSPVAQAYTTFGAPDCGKWVNAPSNQQKAWLLGFMSGMNANHQVLRPELKDPLDPLNSADQIFLWMDNYCKANPLKTVGDGGVALFTELLRNTR